MKKRFWIAAGAAMWLLLWATDTGVLILSLPDEYGGRTCRYLIGLSIVRTGKHEWDRHGRCPLLIGL